VNRDELKTRLMAEAETAIDKILANKPASENITLSEIEQLALGGGRDFREAVLKNLVAEGQDTQPGEAISCPQCGSNMHSKGKRTKIIVTEAGEVSVERDYYYCAACKQGVFPPG
jgi:DNA-directed RNA polymerase subunit RPC12/RpoP